MLLFAHAITSTYTVYVGNVCVMLRLPVVNVCLHVCTYVTYANAYVHVCMYSLCVCLHGTFMFS